MKAVKMFLIILTIFLINLNDVFPCPVPYDTVIFVYSVHPDFPFDKFSKGALGILQPTFKRSFLFVAYRYLIGKGLDHKEQQAMLTLWDDYMDLRSDYDNKKVVKLWLDTRSKVPGIDSVSSLNIFKYSRVNRMSYLNCPDDTFKTAAKTLEERMKYFGRESNEVIEWVLAQDIVFKNCERGPSIPGPVKPGTHPLIGADRNYQVASAHFYAGNFIEAEKLFRQIAKDTSSPWKNIAPYLVARTLVRDATLNAGINQSDTATLEKAEKELQKILHDKTLGDFHKPASRLLALVHFHLYPRERLHKLSQAILNTNSGETLKQDFWDFTLLFSKFEDKDLNTLKELAQQDDVMDWLLTFRNQDGAALLHSLKKWKERSSLPWLIASLGKISSAHPSISELLRAAEAVKEDSPAFLTVAYHRIRLMIELGEKEEARKILDQIISKNIVLSQPSTMNLLFSLRMKLATNMDEFIKYAQRIPAGIIVVGGEINRGLEIPEKNQDYPNLKSLMDGKTLLDADSVRQLNMKIPLSLLRDVCKNMELPTHLRKNLVLSTWVRSVLLERHDIGMELVPLIENLTPEIKPWLELYVTASNTKEKKFVAIFTILKFPGMRPYISGGVERLTPLREINDFRDNWWCTFKLDPKTDDFQNYYQTISNPFQSHTENPRTESLLFLTDKQRAEAEEEWKILSKIGAAPSYLVNEVIHWAKSTSNDNRVPEALHLAVKSTRFGCTDSETSKFSEAAFKLLHKRYPKSIWTRKTPYWFN